MDRIRSAVASTIGDLNVIGGLGGFAGLLELPTMKNPVLVSAADGVGTKVLIAEALGIYDTVGIDLVAMSVNDLLVTGARPLFFLDYLAVGKLEPEKAASLVEGVAEGCRQSGCALLGGETAEMPDLYQGGHFDLAGFAVGAVERDAIINGSRVEAGDVVIGLPSSGVHSNGFSLVRRILEVNKIGYADKLEGFEAAGGVGAALLTPTKIYARDVAALMAAADVRAMAHITGGGLAENLVRVIPGGLLARVERSRWQVPALFDTLQRLGNVQSNEMFRTFNMGIGYVVVVPAADEAKALAAVSGATRIGEVIVGDRQS
ncbi:MAG: phosphoribosylformylglycinamidine cyclo-ligase [Actinobacteria bacterium]|nr:phosphoribosylformylglycinamidine cyclo-ligase [Actinomycetota bacterium]MCL5882916.1 phosphoribosylformylglycinamidine cyclo-ligase [Actinomycetota bacterium]